MFLACLAVFLVGSSSFLYNKAIKPRSAHVLQLVKAITSDEEFQRLVLEASSSNPNVPICIVDFQKSKCRPCIRAAPVFEKLSEKYGDIANFYKVDADSWPGALKLMKSHGVKTVPTFQIWRNGIKVETIEGSHLEELEQKLAPAIL